VDDVYGGSDVYSPAEHAIRKIQERSKEILYELIVDNVPDLSYDFKLGGGARLIEILQTMMRIRSSTH